MMEKVRFRKYEVSWWDQWFVFIQRIYSYRLAPMVPPITKYLHVLYKPETTLLQFALTNSLHFRFWIEALPYDLVQTLQIWWATRQSQVFWPVISQFLPATMGIKPRKNESYTFFTRFHGYVTVQLLLCRWSRWLEILWFLLQFGKVLSRRQPSMIFLLD